MARARRGVRGPLAVGLPLLIMVMALASSIGSVHLPLSSVASVAWAHLQGHSASDALADQILWDIRFPRVLLAALVGAALSVAGVVFQALVRNPLADPFVLGVASGASVGAVLVFAFGSAAAAGLGATSAGFVTALITTGAVFALAQRFGRITSTRLILSGVAVAYLANAITSYVQLSTKPGQLQGIMFWLLGSLAGSTWSQLQLASIVVGLLAAWLVLRSRALNAMAAGDDAAFGLGINVFAFRIELLVVGSLLTATVVSVAGGVGFVGLIIPHVTRLLVGGDHRRVVGVSMVIGAVFLVLVDVASRTLDSPNELPIGILTAAIGAPFFLFLMRRRDTTT
ncbi:iron ABC transporter permease [Williamsia sp. CHRR-6]|uniref:FecCD family ABC transporter permease n=1 Tax=Williamsia sp. CHRR-6 TaxID=2835871 RepID=UPI0027DE275C|nr:iron ABC transporter permease [Williamsia sp. CHRR-6]